LLLWYFFQSQVIEYFGMKGLQKAKALAKLLAALAAVFALATSITLLA
jgi:hypothetical protein